MNAEMTEWVWRLVNGFEPVKVILPTKEIVGYIYNRKKRILRFLTEKETRKLSRKRIVWKRLGEDWGKG